MCGLKLSINKVCILEMYYKRGEYFCRIIGKKWKTIKKKGMIVSGYFNPIYKGILDTLTKAKHLQTSYLWLWIMIIKEHKKEILSLNKNKNIYL